MKGKYIPASILSGFFYFLIPLISIAQQGAFEKDHAQPIRFSRELMESDLRAAASAVSRVSNADPAYKRFFQPQEKTDLELNGLIADILQDDPLAVKKGMEQLIFTGDKRTQVNLAFFLGDFYFRNVDYLKAIDLLEKTDALYLSDAENEKIQFEKGVSYFSLKKFDNAKPYFKSLIQLEKSSYRVDAKYYLGFISFSERFYDDALSQFREIEKDPRYKKTVPFYMAFIYREKGDVEKAIRVGEEYMHDSEALHIKEVQQFLASLYFNKGDYSKSIGLYEKALSNGVLLEPVQRYELGIGYHEIAKFTKAIEQLKPLSLGKDSIAGESMFYLADSYVLVNDKRNARSSFLFALNLPISPESREVAGFNYAKLSLELGYPDQGFQKLNEFISAYPNSSFMKEAREIQITYYAKSNNFQEALDLLKKITLTSAVYNQIVPRMYFGRSMELINEIKNEQALSYLDEVLKFRASSFYSAAIFWKGEIYYRSEQYDDAIKYFNDYLKTDQRPLGEANALNASYNLAYAYFEKEQYEKALPFFEKVSSNSIAENEMKREASIRAADCAFMLKNVIKAKTIYKQISAGAGFGVDYASFQLAIIEGIKNPAEKIRMLKELEIRFPTSDYLPILTLEIADTYISEEEYQKALPYLDKINGLVNSDDEMLPQSILKKGICYYNLERQDDAIAVYKKLLKEYPNSDEAADAIESARTIFIEKGKINEYEAFLQSGGRTINELQKDSLLYQSIQTIALNNNKIETYKALENYKNQFPSGMYISEVLNQYGGMLQHDKRWKESAAAFDALSERGVSKYLEKALRQAGKIYFFELKDYANALKNFNILSSMTTSNEIKLECLRGAVRANYYLKNWTIGAADAESLLGFETINPDDKAYAEVVLGYNDQIGKVYNSSIEHFKLAAKTNTGSISAEARYNISFDYFSSDDLNAAEKSAMETIQKSGSDYWVTKTYILLGEIFLRQKDYFNARATLQSVIDNTKNVELKAEATEKMILVESDEKSNIKK